MSTEVPGTIYTLLGAAAASADDPAIALRAPLDALAALCEARIELWVQGDDNGDARLLAVGGDGSTTAAPEHERGTRDDDQTAVSAPLIVRGQQYGLITARGGPAGAPRADAGAILQQVAPLLALFVRSLLPELGLASATIVNARESSTGRERLKEALQLELARARRARAGCAVLLSGVDRIDDLTAALGPEAGDMAISAFAELLRQTCRDTDVIGRLEDGRFAIILAGSDSRGAQLAATRLLGEIHARGANLSAAPGPLSASIGIALFPVDGFSADELLESASAALSEAKRLGGNQVAAA